MANERSWLLRHCIREGALPGHSQTIAYLTQCADALNGSDSCDFPPACTADHRFGSLPLGSACVDSDQCQSGECKHAPYECGTCVAPLAEGETCGGSVHCAPHLVCRSEEPPVGTCQKPPRTIPVVADGEPCSRLTFERIDCSEPTSRCLKVRDGNPVCGPRRRFGEFCGEGDCERGLACVASACAAPLSVGAPCTGDRECMYGLRCDGSTKRCATYGGEGETCGSFTDCLQGLRCDAGRCVRAAQEGQPCDASASSPPCESPLDCIRGVCKLLSADVCGSARDQRLSR